MLPTNGLLLFSVLCHQLRSREWAREGPLGDALRFTIGQMLRHIHSTTTLSDEGDKVPLGEVSRT